MPEQVSESQLAQLGEFLTGLTGLKIPPHRSGDLRRAISLAGRDLKLPNATEFMRALLTVPAGEDALERLVNHLTIGETYFFREMRAFDLLGNEILPLLIQARRGTSRHVRIWSAACCTGEEAYSIAILLRQVIPDFETWNIEIIATDINSRFLQKAREGIYGPWSFRGAPEWLQRRYFRPVGGGQFEILPELRDMIRFSRINLAHDSYPGTDHGNPIDVIFCRNVLMYFTDAQAERVIQRLHRAQAEDGRLILGPSELPAISCHPYRSVHRGGILYYQKGGKDSATPLKEPAPIPLILTRPKIAQARPAKRPPRQHEPAKSTDARDAALLLADKGKLSEALQYCDRWLSDDRLNASAHYLRAIILVEQGLPERAAESLRSALYLDPHSIEAHFAMGNIARKRGDGREAVRHLRNARQALDRYRPEQVLPELHGVTAGRFIQMVDALLETEATA